MKGKVFIDTNILVYLFSTGESEKRIICHQKLEGLKIDNVLVWSTQVIQEFYNVMTRKFGKEPQLVKSSLTNFREFETITNSILTINKAIDIQVLNKLSFWDSLIIAAANQAMCQVILSEDLSHNQSIEGITIQNPFI